MVAMLAAVLAVGAVAMKAPEEHAKAKQAHLHEVPHYWLFRNSDGILWLKATGQDAAMSAAGHVLGGFRYMYMFAGTALRMAQREADRLKLPILNLDGLQKEAAADPEPKTDYQAAHNARVKGAK